MYSASVAVPETVFLLGMNASGTCTLVNIVNAHPAAFVLNQIEFDKGADETPRNREIVAAMPESLCLFGRADHGIYRELAAMCAVRGYPFRMVGNKLLWQSARELERAKPFRSVFMVRDVRNWAAKNANILNFYPARYPDWEANIVPAITDHVACYINSFRLERCLRVRLKDLLARPDKTVEAIADHLGLSDGVTLMKSWHALPLMERPHPKAMSDWQVAHPSARLRPGGLDTGVVLDRHAFWTALLPIFDKYFEATQESFSQAEIDADLAALARIRSIHVARLDDLYLSYWSMTLTGVVAEGPDAGRMTFRAPVARAQPLCMQPAMA